MNKSKRYLNTWVQETEKQETNAKWVNDKCDVETHNQRRNPLWEE